jgi:protein SCO1
MQFGGEWSLIGTDNTPFGSKELRGSYYLMYFGFSHCPDVCPSSLTYLS